MLNRLNSVSEPTRYRVVVLTSWDRTDRNSAGQIASAADVHSLFNFALLCDTFAFFAVQIPLIVNLKAGKSKTAKDAKVSQRSRKDFRDDA